MKAPRFLPVVVVAASLLLLQACNNIVTTRDIDPDAHLTRNDYLELRHRGDGIAPQPPPKVPPIPELSSRQAPPPVRTTGADKLVSVSVTDKVPLRDVLIDLARDANANLELDPRIEGGVIFSAHNQPFSDVLNRLCSLAGLRASREGKFIRVELDEPYQETYQLDYLSLARRSTSDTSIATNVFDVNVTNGGGNGNSGGGSNTNGSSTSENNSTSRLQGVSDIDFWGDVDRSISRIVASNARIADKDKPQPVSSYSIDKQAGLVTVYGNSKQQAAVDNYLVKLKRKAYAQVLIDARIVEVELNDEFKSGINWSALFGNTFGMTAAFTPATVTAGGVFAAAFHHDDLNGLIRMVRSFGTTRVLSSPRLTVLNNQTAILKVATNQVYFVTQAQFTTVTNANGSSVTTTPVYTSTPHTVPVGLVMSVQPAIDPEHGRITMTLRPTISRVVDEVNDPSIGLNAAQAGVSTPVQSQIPVLAVREMDSVIQLHSGEIAVMGGLMQDSSQNNDEGIPLVDELPVIGTLAKSRDNAGHTTELVILLRATLSDSPQPDMADSELYQRYNADPRPVPMPVPLPTVLGPVPPLPSRSEDDDTTDPS